MPCYSQGVRQANQKAVGNKKVEFTEFKESLFAAHIVCFRKSKGSLRVTVDLRMINKNLINNAYLLHEIDDQIDSMCSAARFATLYLTEVITR